MVFKKTKDIYGGLSNMASGYLIYINGEKILSSEALYQAMRYPNNPEIQHEILKQKSPMTAKMISKKYRQLSRSDWNEVRITIMRWCLRIKLINNWDKFNNLLISTNGKEIVEESHKDDFWGAIPSDKNLLVGTNALGRLLMELRRDLDLLKAANNLIINIPDMKLYNKNVNNLIINIKERSAESIDKKISYKEYKNLSLFD